MYEIKAEDANKDKHKKNKKIESSSVAEKLALNPSASDEEKNMESNAEAIMKNDSQSESSLPTAGGITSVAVTPKSKQSTANNSNKNKPPHGKKARKR